MARGKKAAKELSPEEKLQQALVPAEEWPYPIPENWCWVRLGSLCTDIQYGYTAKAIFDNNYPKMLRITDIQGGEVDWDNVPNCEITENDFKKYELVSHDIVFARTGATTGKSCFVLEPPKSVYASYLIRIRLNSSFNKKYVYYILQSEVYWKQIMELSSGIAQPGVNAAKLQSLLCPLSPLSEQQRIVDRIESLFAKLDEAKEKAQAVVDGFELRKSAILHKAFTGELTERWRKEHGEGLDGWKNTTLSEIVSGFKYGTSEKSTYNNTGMPVLRIPNVGTGTLSFEDMKYLAHNDVDEANQVHENDLLIIRSNGSRDLVGKCAIVPALSRKFAYASFLIRIKPSEWILPDYLALYLNSTDARTQMFKKAKSSAGIHNINSQELGSITINVPTIYEQSAIIAVLNNLLAKGQQAKEAAEAVLIQIDTMKKAILARAFRGELGTNDPAEESAEKLIKAVL